MTQTRWKNSGVILGGTNFGRISSAVGARGFAGEGYRTDALFKLLGKDWTGTALACKTITLKPRRGKKFLDENGKPEGGNAPLKADGFTLEEIIPKCVWVNPLHGGDMINAFSLSSFGVKFYRDSGCFSKIHEPFYLSIMLMEHASDWEDELREICNILLPMVRRLSVPVALQINFGCPNAGHDLSHFYGQMCTLVALAKSILKIPVIINCNALMPASVLAEAAKVADALWIGNTIPFGSETGVIDWKRFGEKSPLQLRGFEQAGGLSSPLCTQLSIDLIKTLRDLGVNIPIIGGNGIRRYEDVMRFQKAGANGVFIGSVTMVAPWETKSIIHYANNG